MRVDKSTLPFLEGGPLVTFLTGAIDINYLTHVILVQDLRCYQLLEPLNRCYYVLFFVAVFVSELEARHTDQTIV